MKKLFNSIRKGEITIVKNIIENNNSLVNSTAKQPPKKDDGKSPLQVALKSSQFEIAEYLIDKGADLNFIETETINEWRTPVIHDAIHATIFSCRYPVLYGEKNSKNDFKKAFNILKKIVALNVNLNVQDSYGNNCAMRAALDANQFNYSKDCKELIEDLTEVFNFLKQSGVDFNEKTNTHEAPIKIFLNSELILLMK